MAITAILATTPSLISRNNFTGSVGFEFIAARNINLTFLGRPVGSLFANSHNVKVWRVSDTTEVATASITTSSSTSNGWAYAACTPVTLTSGTKYRIASTETSGGDNWQNESIITGFSVADIGSLVSCFSGTQNVYPSILSVAGNAYVWPNMYEGSSSSLLTQIERGVRGLNRGLYSGS